MIPSTAERKKRKKEGREGRDRRKEGREKNLRQSKSILQIKLQLLLENYIV